MFLVKAFAVTNVINIFLPILRKGEKVEFQSMLLNTKGSHTFGCTTTLDILFLADGLAWGLGRLRVKKAIYGSCYPVPPSCSSAFPRFLFLLGLKHRTWLLFVLFSSRSALSANDNFACCSSAPWRIPGSKGNQMILNFSKHFDLLSFLWGRSLVSKAFIA